MNPKLFQLRHDPSGLGWAFTTGRSVSRAGDHGSIYEEINSSSVIQESDFAPYKPKCDILFAHAVAYASEGKPSKSWPIGVKVGDWEKR